MLIEIVTFNIAMSSTSILRRALVDTLLFEYFFLATLYMFYSEKIQEVFLVLVLMLLVLSICEDRGCCTHSWVTTTVYWQSRGYHRYLDTRSLLKLWSFSHSDIKRGMQIMTRKSQRNKSVFGGSVQSLDYIQMWYMLDLLVRYPDATTTSFSFFFVCWDNERSLPVDMIKKGFFFGVMSVILDKFAYPWWLFF